MKSVIFFVIFSTVIVPLSLNLESPLPKGSSVDGLTVDEFKGLADSIPKLPGQIQSVVFFRESGGPIKNAAFAILGDAGWQIIIFEHKGGARFEVKWRSGPLDDSFRVSSAGALRVVNPWDEDQIEFEGCAGHNCPGVFSIMLYAPSRNLAYIARYVNGKVEYSSNSQSADNGEVREFLSQEVERHATNFHSP